jgi:urease accessory protein
MSVVISLSDARAERAPPRASAVRGIAEVAYGGGADGARLKFLYQQDPLRILFPHPTPGDLPLAVFVTTSGGLVGGDRLELTGRAEAATAVQMTAQAAEKVYRSTGAVSTIDVTLTCDDGGWLEWLPQETIVFDGARLIRRTRADVAAGGRLLAGEFVVFGRTAMGESFDAGILRDEWEIRRDGRLIWADAFALERDIPATLAHPAGLGGAKAVATVVYAGDDAPETLNMARRLLAAAGDAVRVGASVVNGVLVARFLSADSMALRQAFGAFWAAFRNELTGLPAKLPRIWHV